jgi:hypothetical protein
MARNDGDARANEGADVHGGANGGTAHLALQQRSEGSDGMRFVSFGACVEHVE